MTGRPPAGAPKEVVLFDRLSLAGLALLALIPRTAGACDPVWLPISREPNLAYFVASVTGRAELGVRARMIEAGGAAAGLAPGDAILVPWAYGPDCRPIPWGSGQRWRPPDGPAFYTGQIRPRSAWLKGLPTIDVHMAWREPLWQMSDRRWPHPVSGGSLLAPAELLQLYAVLPTHTDLSRDPAGALAGLEAWSARHPAIVGREPGATILANLRRATAARASP